MSKSFRFNSPKSPSLFRDIRPVFSTQNVSGSKFFETQQVNKEREGSSSIPLSRRVERELKANQMIEEFMSNRESEGKEEGESKGKGKLTVAEGKLTVDDAKLLLDQGKLSLEKERLTSFVMEERKMHLLNKNLRIPVEKRKLEDRIMWCSILFEDKFPDQNILFSTCEREKLIIIERLILDFPKHYGIQLEQALSYDSYQGLIDSTLKWEQELWNWNPETNYQYKPFFPIEYVFLNMYKNDIYVGPLANFVVKLFEYCLEDSKQNNYSGRPFSALELLGRRIMLEEKKIMNLINFHMYTNPWYCTFFMLRDASFKVKNIPIKLSQEISGEELYSFYLVVKKVLQRIDPTNIPSNYSDEYLTEWNLTRFSRYGSREENIGNPIRILFNDIISEYYSIYQKDIMNLTCHYIREGILRHIPRTVHLTREQTFFLLKDKTTVQNIMRNAEELGLSKAEQYLIRKKIKKDDKSVIETIPLDQETFERFFDLALLDELEYMLSKKKFIIRNAYDKVFTKDPSEGLEMYSKYHTGNPETKDRITKILRNISSITKL